MDIDEIIFNHGNFEALRKLVKEYQEAQRPSIDLPIEPELEQPIVPEEEKPEPEPETKPEPKPEEEPEKEPEPEPELKRAREEDGTFKADDPATEENEAFEPVI